MSSVYVWILASVDGVGDVFLIDDDLLTYLVAFNCATFSTFCVVFLVAAGADYYYGTSSPWASKTMVLARLSIVFLLRSY